MSTTQSFATAVSTGTGRQAFGTVDLAIGDQGTGRAQAVVGVLSETVPVTSFTDGGAAIGTYQMAGGLPAGAIVLASRILVPAGFAGDVSATLKIGDGVTADRYMTGTPSVFATAVAGVDCGAVSGAKLVTAENRPTLTVTSAADFTSVKTNAAGIVTVSIYYIQA